MEYRITDDLDKLKHVLPPFLNEALDMLGNSDELLEIVLDLGRVPTARYVNGEVVLRDREITRSDLDTIVSSIGDFDADNRAGMERTLHRISAIRNRRSEVVGLTCRIGRAVYGTIDIVQDLVETGQSILMLGPPGVGKTTMLREAARVLAETRRVVIVDTSNEIGGDGDVPHPAVGRARRMQVSKPDRQHEVMIEAVENHNPEVIVIDEIGRELEAQAARTIAERGVQLIGTAHGNALDNLMLNPTLSDLVGGIESVTLSDEEARRRGTQKSVLERRAPPTFDVLIEIQNRNRFVVHEDVAAAVDGALRGRPVQVEVRSRNEAGEIVIETANPELSALSERNNRSSSQMNSGNGGGRNGRISPRGQQPHTHGSGASYGQRGEENVSPPMSRGSEPMLESRPLEGINTAGLKTMHVYAYGVARNRLQQAAKRLRLPLIVLDDIDDSEAIVTLKNYYRRRPKLIVDAERRGTPIYVLRANTVTQMENFLVDMFGLEVSPQDPFGGAMREVEAAIQQIRAGVKSVDLAPQAPHVRRMQHEKAREAQLVSHSYGAEPGRHVRIFREQKLNLRGA